MKKSTPHMFVQLSIVSLSCLALLSACGEVKKIDEMKDNTHEMNDTTKTLLNETKEMKSDLKDMSKPTEEMNGTTSELRDLTRDKLVPRMEKVEAGTSELYDAMRQGDSSHLRREAMEKIQLAKTLQARLSEAGMLMLSFEYQLLGDVGTDPTNEKRMSLYQQAMLEFFLRLEEVAPKFNQVLPAAQPNDDVSSEDNKAATFNAIALALHKNNRKQNADPIYGKAMSIYDLILVALRSEREIDAGRMILPEGPHFIKEVLARKNRAHQLLQARYNAFPFALAGLTTDLHERSKLGQIFKLLLSVDVDIRESTRGVAALQYFEDEILGPAAQTTFDMQSVGVTPKRETMTTFFISRLNIQPFDGTEMTAREKRLKDLWQAYVYPQGTDVRASRN